MRMLFYILACVILILAATVMSARGDEKGGAPKDVPDELALPSQTIEEGAHNFLLEMRGSYPASYLVVRTYFPQGLSKEADKALTAKARELHSTAYKEALEVLEDTVLTENMSEASAALLAGTPLPDHFARPDWRRSYISAATYELSHPSKRCVSALYRIYWFSGGAHPNWVYRAVTLDRESGKSLGIEDVFPGKDSVRQALTDLLYKKLSSQVKDLSPDALSPEMDRMVLTPKGLRVVYAPYEIASFAEGDFFVDLDLNDLLPLGADKSLWGE